MTKKLKPGTRFPLLIYQRLFQMWFLPSTLLLIASVALIVLNPPLLGDLRWWFVPVALIAAGLMVYALLARFTTYVQAHPRTLRVRAPIYRLVISYGRVNVVRTTPLKMQFPPERLSWRERPLVEKLYGKTCITVELQGLPIPKPFLTLLLGRFLLSETVQGLVLLVEDWLQLSNEIEGARAEWVSRRFTRREERTVERILRG